MSTSALEPTIIRVPLERSFCLYGDEGLAFLQDLDQRLSARPPSTTALFFLQKVALSDHDPLWWKALEKRWLWADLAGRLQQVKSLIQGIAQRGIPTIFVGSGSCLGSWWELASSCSQRLWYRPDALLGFSDGALRALPCYQMHKSRALQLSEAALWETAAPFTAEQAFAQKIISCICFGEDHDARTQEWLNRWQERREPLLLANTEAPLFSSLLPFPEVEKLFPKLLISRPAPTVEAWWDLCWQLLKSSRRAEQLPALNSALCYSLARYYLSPAYYHHALVKKTSVAPSSTREYDSTEKRAPVLAIDISENLPPLSSIKDLLAASFEILFTGEESPGLTQQLELLYQKLRGIYGSDMLGSIWGRSLHWFPRKNSIPRALELQWRAHDRVEMHIGAHHMSFTTLAGTHLLAERAYWEASPGTPHPHTIAMAPAFIPLLLDMLCRGIICGQASDLRVSYSAWLRVQFFDELIRLSSRWGDGLEKTLGSLKAAGWENVGESEWWKSFLAATPTSNFVSWKKTCRSAEPRFPQDPALTHPQAESLHMAYFSALLGFSLEQQGRFSSSEEADVLTCAALGFPTQYKSTRFFLSTWGKKRCYYYWQKNWPDLARGRTE